MHRYIVVIGYECRVSSSPNNIQPSNYFYSYPWTLLCTQTMLMLSKINLYSNLTIKGKEKQIELHLIKMQSHNFTATNCTSLPLQLCWGFFLFFFVSPPQKNQHEPLRQGQFWSGVINHSISGIKINFNTSVKNTIVQHCRFVSQGLLVLYEKSSYSSKLTDAYHQCWRKTNMRQLDTNSAS